MLSGLFSVKAGSKYAETAIDKTDLVVATLANENGQTAIVSIFEHKGLLTVKVIAGPSDGDGNIVSRLTQTLSLNPQP